MPSAASGVLPSGRHRRDIQGLRAVAVLLVCLNHAGVGFLKGGYVGVDVFFVLSGFLITSILVGDAAKHQSISLATFYQRRARRILPAATLTLVVTAIASYRILNVVRAKQALIDILASALFAANIRFTHTGTDYFAQGQPESPVRHFWSLAVEEQFYLVWPTILAIIMFGWLLIRRSRPRQITNATTTRVLVCVAAIFAASLYWSIHQTRTDPTVAYFSTFTRAWELALGAGLAIGARHLTRLPSSVRVLLGWVGLAAIGAAAVLYTGETAFPGSAALLPCLGAAAVIAAGINPRAPRVAAGHVLGAPPMHYIGDISYTLYLWHWPILILAAEKHGDQLSVGTNLLLVAVAIAVSAVTFRFFEDPIRRSETVGARQPALIMWILGPVVVGLCVVLLQDKIDAQQLAAFNAQASVQVAQEAAADQRLTAAQQAKADATAQKLLAANQPLPAVVKSAQLADKGAGIPAGAAPSPQSGSLAKDLFQLPGSCRPGLKATSAPICAQGSGSRTLVLFGDSHAQMWLPTILEMAKRDGWRVMPIFKEGCTVRTWSGVQKVQGCPQWYRWAQKQVRTIKPDATVIAARYLLDTPGTPPNMDVVTQTFTDLVGGLKKSSKRVLVLGDVFGETKQPVDCLLASNANMDRCSGQLDPDRLAAYQQVQTTTVNAGGGFIDSKGWLCALNRCPVVIGRTVAYLDNSHLTETYARQLGSPFRAAFRQASRAAASSA
jgi:peptidoglycan/LPS O-acetylase OafA/YrhL